MDESSSEDSIFAIQDRNYILESKLNQISTIINNAKVCMGDDNLEFDTKSFIGILDLVVQICNT
jgi:hypothetical protein